MRATDFKDAWKRGLKAEDQFRDILINRGNSFRGSSLNEQYMHIDFIMSNGVTIDVKSDKQ